MSSAATSYDELPYDGGSFPLTHPLKLGWIAALHGLTPAPVRTCRVLEIGCGDGSNLLPLAECYPEAQFHGFDLSQRHIDLARPRDLEVTYTPEFTDIVHELRGHIGAMRKQGAGAAITQ